MYCKFCGEPIDQNTVECGSCGSKIDIYDGGQSFFEDYELEMWKPEHVLNSSIPKTKMIPIVTQDRSILPSLSTVSSKQKTHSRQSKSDYVKNKRRFENSNDKSNVSASERKKRKTLYQISMLVRYVIACAILIMIVVALVQIIRNSNGKGNEGMSYIENEIPNTTQVQNEDQSADLEQESTPTAETVEDSDDESVEEVSQQADISFNPVDTIDNTTKIQDKINGNTYVVTSCFDGEKPDINNLYIDIGKYLEEESFQFEYDQSEEEKKVYSINSGDIESINQINKIEVDISTSAIHLYEADTESEYDITLTGKMFSKNGSVYVHAETFINKYYKQAYTKDCEIKGKKKLFSNNYTLKIKEN